MNKKVIMLMGSIFTGLAVALGAFGAHALKPVLLANNRLDVYETAVRYQMIHGLALLIAGVWMGQLQTPVGLNRAAESWTAGIVLFSGSLYGLSLSSITAFAYATPLGGLFFLAGWGLFIRAIVLSR